MQFVTRALFSHETKTCHPEPALPAKDLALRVFPAGRDSPPSATAPRLPGGRFAKRPYEPGATCPTPSCIGRRSRVSFGIAESGARESGSKSGSGGKHDHDDVSTPVDAAFPYLSGGLHALGANVGEFSCCLCVSVVTPITAETRRLRWPVADRYRPW